MPAPTGRRVRDEIRGLMAGVRRSTATVTTSRPLRRDAELNRLRVLEAAREVFAACGLTTYLRAAGLLASAAESLSGLEDVAVSLDSAARRIREAQEMM